MGKYNSNVNATWVATYHKLNGSLTMHLIMEFERSASPFSNGEIFSLGGGELPYRVRV